MKINKLYQQIGILLIVIILTSSFVSAFGVGSAYYKENPLKISAGETKEIIFNLQNGPGPQDITAKPSITKGAEILELIDSENVLVSVGGAVDIKVKVNIPNDAKIGEVYPVEVTFTTVSTEAGAFGLVSSVSRNFDVIIVPTPEEISREEARLAEQKPIPLWIIGLIILIAILIILVIWFILKKKK